ncbi:unnamed protein product [Mytilus edulis]|uniref:RING-type domain-containing protein n=1 Tax=Mytilus edulis TaxID=6550 RepID=A0A8S3T4H0_MYTED|nr:unnamed protein product [Mytilus edulis]
MKCNDILILVSPSQLLEMYYFEKNVQREEKFIYFPEAMHTSMVCANEQTLIERVKLHCIIALLINSEFENESEMLSYVDMRLSKIPFKKIILTDCISNIEDKLFIKNIRMIWNSLYHVSKDESLEIDISLWNLPYKISILSDFIGNIEDKLVLKTILDTLCLYTTYKVADDKTTVCFGETDENNEEWRSLFNLNLESLETFWDQYTFCGKEFLLLRNAIYEDDDDVGIDILTWLLDNLYENETFETSKIIDRKDEQYFSEEKIPLRNLSLFSIGTLCILKGYKYPEEKFMNFHSCEYENYHCHLLQLWLSRNTNFTDLFHIYIRTSYSIDNQIPYMQQQKEIKHFLWNYMTTYIHKSLHDKLVKAQGKLRNVRICRLANIYLPTPVHIDRDNCQLSCEFYALLGISSIIAQVTLVVLKNLLLVDNCNHETKSREKTMMNLCLLSCLVSFKQVIYSCEAHTQEDRTYFLGKGLSKTTHQEIQTPGKNVMLKEMVKGVLTSDCKSVKSILYDIINHDEIFRNVEITAYPVNGYNGMSNEILRVGSLNNFPSENSPSLIKLAKYGFYYEGKGREVTCFSCGIKHEDWSYRSNPLEVHRQISPYCEYLKTLAPSDQPVFRPSLDIESDNRHNASPSMPTTEIPYQNGIGTDSIHTCTDAHGTPMTVAVQSVDSGLFGSSLSHSSNNLVTSNSTSISSISQRSSRASTDSGFGSKGSISTDNSSSSSHNSNLAVPQLPPLLEGGEHSIQRVSGPASRDSPVPQNNRKNTPKEKYPEYIPIERRRATYKNWPPNLDFLHPLDLSECGFFYSNFGDCVRCFHCGIGLRNWESDDNPWVEHARWSRKCPYLLQRKGQEFIDSVLSVLGLQTDSEIEMQTANAGTEPASQVSSGYGTASANDVRDPVCHPAAQYIIRENIFGDNKEKQVKKTMNQLLQNHEWDDITNDMLVNALLESKDIMENLDTKTNSLNLSESAVSNSSESSHSNTQSTKPENKNKEEESKKSGEEDPDKIQKENEELKDLYTCKICLDERVGITFVPCGHLVTCKDCSPKIRRCPLCRTFIRGTIKTTM